MARSEGKTDAEGNRIEAHKRIKRQRRLGGNHGSRVWLRTRRRVRKKLLGG